VCRRLNLDLFLDLCLDLYPRLYRALFEKSFAKSFPASFGPILGCSLGTPESVQLGAHYAIKTLKPKVFMPMHSGQATYRYRDFVAEAAERNYQTQLAYALNEGDRFIYRDGKIDKVH